MTPVEIRTAVLEAMKQTGGVFSWPDDGVCGEPWAYWIHVAWVEAWNAEGRKTRPLEFLSAWLTDENITAALLRQQQAR